MFSSTDVALVTGSSSGIGAAAAVRFAQRGARVVVHYNRNKAGAEEVCSRIESKGGTACMLQADLTDHDAGQSLVADVEARFGQLDILVNNAGTVVGRRLLAEITPDFWQKVFDVNLSSALWVTQAATPGMKRRGKGAVVNISSVSARNGGSLGVMAYAAMKAGLLCMTKNIARELAPHGIRVNAVNPGIIPTPLHDEFTPPQLMSELVKGIPQGRAGTVEEVADVIAFLASSQASHIIGETIEVNGGLVMD